MEVPLSVSKTDKKYSVRRYRASGCRRCMSVREGKRPYGRCPSPALPSREPRLGDRTRSAMRLRDLSPRTENAYLNWMLRFYEYHGRRNPAEFGTEHVTELLSSLATKHKVAASTQNQALAARLSSIDMYFMSSADEEDATWN